MMVMPGLSARALRVMKTLAASSGRTVASPGRGGCRPVRDLLVAGVALQHQIGIGVGQRDLAVHIVDHDKAGEMPAGEFAREHLADAGRSRR